MVSAARRSGTRRTAWCSGKTGSTPTSRADIAYHLNKFERGFDRLIDVWGADHHGYIAREKGALQALGINPGPAHRRAGAVRGALSRRQESFHVHARAGDFVTLRELRNEVGNDAARFFYVLRKSDQHLDFDLDLAKSQSSDNPVYYVQYAHARDLQRPGTVGRRRSLRCDVPISSRSRRSRSCRSCAWLMDYPAVIEDAARDLAPHLVAFYLKDLAAVFHSYYNSTHFLVDDEHVKLARLSLVRGAAAGARERPQALGVSAPAKM